MKKSLLAIGFIAILVACGTAKNSTAKVEAMPSQSDVDRVASKFPGYTLEELNDGKKLFEANCALCHRLKKPTSEPESEWKTIVPRMVVKVNKKLGSTVVDASGEEKILRYLITMGSVPK
ncbi:cytochrome c class I [Fluviicola taffensis]|uniref:Cytochrome c class I n=1 Tax=Fluviicola taffensis (strain DSM 16823 / NCIMB 13979 / RW262) TaxID=755732 RepID=F2IB57_FLUTR|nr:cytochrome c class I [Fluviicola taffensis]AEA42140.1 cytochrome c class I [Fluviicola taffensis DSM 16823]